MPRRNSGKTYSYVIRFIIFGYHITKMENLLSRITVHAEICNGKPTIRGLKYPVDSMLELMDSGVTIEELLEDYPDLEREDFVACLEYASTMHASPGSK